MKKPAHIGEFIFAILILFFVARLVYAELGLDFEIPAPPKGTLADTKDFVYGGRLTKNYLYKTEEKPEKAESFYRRFFQAQGFKEVPVNLEIKISDFKLLRFKREDLVVSVSLTSRPEGTEVAIGKYLEPPGSQPLDKIKPTIKDSIFALPETDQPGEDLPFIPRPPQGVRWNSSNMGQSQVLMYVTPLSVAQTVEFYRVKMFSQGWKTKQAMKIDKIVKTYKQVTGTKKLGMKLPVEGGEDLEGVINDSYYFEFAGINGKANVTIFPNYIDRKKGSIVQIDYSKDSQL